MARRRKGSGTAKGARRAAKLQKRKTAEGRRGGSEFGGARPLSGFPPACASRLDECGLREMRELLGEAADWEDSGAQVVLARAALELLPECPQAHALLACCTPSLQESVHHYMRAVELADRELGAEFDRRVGAFGESPETRQCLELRCELAARLWPTGRREEALERWSEVLWLDAEDTLGVRWGLACRLVQLDHFETAAELVEQFDEPFAVWDYLKALLTFQRDGDTAAARSHLHDAVELNRHFVPYLAGHELLPGDLPRIFDLGHESEALACLGDLLPAWRRVPGAVPWLRRALHLAPRADEPSQDPPAALLARRRAEVAALPPCDEVWLADARALPAPDSDEVSWIVYVLDLTNEQQLALAFEPQELQASRLLGLLFDAMRSPRAGEPRRPACVEFASQRWHDELLEDVQALGIETELGDTQQIDAGFETFLEEAARPTPPDERPLSELPRHEHDVWQIDVRRLRTWINDNGEMRRPWVVLVYSLATQLVLATRLTPEPSLATVWQALEEAMRDTRYGEPHRPGRIEVTEEDARTALGPRVNELQIECTIARNLREFEAVYGDLSRTFCDSATVPGLVECGPEAAERVFEIACEFYLRAPWQFVEGDRFIQVEVAGRRPQTWFACVMGQSGMVYGLALYDDRREVDALAAGTLDSDRHHEQTSAIVLTFSEEFEMSFDDLDAAAEHGWPVATPEAWPWVYRVRPGMAVQPLSTGEIAVLEGCLRALPDFLANRQASHEVTVSTSGGPLSLRLSWHN